jgi:ketosteroid isomerase-like protein
MNADMMARLERLEASLQIQQLPARYAMAMDERDLDMLVSLYVEDVDCGGRGRGRAALRSHFADAAAGFYRSIHQIVGHVFDLTDDEHATGRVYCRAEHERGDQWIVAAVCYFDRYERRGDRWLFTNREVDFFYCADLLEYPQAAGFQRWAVPNIKFSPPMMLPRFPSWKKFWAAHTAEEVASLTSKP